MKKRNISATSSLPVFKFNIIPGLILCLVCTLFNPFATYFISISQVNNFQASLNFLSKLEKLTFLPISSIPTFLFWILIFVLIFFIISCDRQLFWQYMLSIWVEIPIHVHTNWRWDFFSRQVVPWFNQNLNSSNRRFLHCFSWLL